MTLASPEIDPLDYHVARVLLLVAAFSRGPSGSLDGLTKLAKLDFLLRYPVYLEKVLETRGKPLDLRLRPTNDERRALESAMIRYKYGPWDDRYYPIIGRLISQGLAEPTSGRGNVALRATALGREVAIGLSGSDWSIVARRAGALKKSLDLSGASLQKLIYDSFPRAVDRPWRTLIDEAVP